MKKRKIEFELLQVEIDHINRLAKKWNITPSQIVGLLVAYESISNFDEIVVESNYGDK